MRRLAVPRGETLFEQYLRDRAIAFDREAAAGSRRPDFRLKTSPVVFCEVKDFKVGPDDQREFDAFAKGQRGGVRSPDQLYARIRDAIGKAAKQLRPAKGSPCVVVLHNDGSTLIFAPFFIGAAMFGNPVIEVPLGGAEPARTVFTKGRMTAENKNTTVSAVAVLSRTEANQALIDQAAAKAAESAPSEDVTRAIVQAVFDLSERAPEAFEQVPYLMVHHNPFALAPLSENVFNGPHDQHFRYR